MAFFLKFDYFLNISFPLKNKEYRCLIALDEARKIKTNIIVFLAAILFAILVLIVYILCSPKEEIPPHYFFKVRQPLIMSKRAWELKKQEEEAAKVII